MGSRLEHTHTNVPLECRGIYLFLTSPVVIKQRENQRTKEGQERQHGNMGETSTLSSCHYTACTVPVRGQALIFPTLFIS